MKKLIFALLFPLLTFGQNVNVQKANDGTNALTGSLVVGSGKTLTATGTGTIVATSGAATTVPWAGVTGTPTTLTGYGITNTLSTTAPITGGGALSGNLTLAMPAATTSVNGYLTSTDWNTFNGKQAAITFPLSASNGGTGVANTGTITLGGNLTTSGAFTTTLTTTGNTSVTLPTTGTLATTAGTVSGITGTANQIAASGSTGNVTLSFPTGTVSTLSGLPNAAGWLHNDGAGVLTYSTPTTVAAASTLTGTTLATNVVNSSLSSIFPAGTSLTIGNLGSLPNILLGANLILQFEGDSLTSAGGYGPIGPTNTWPYYLTTNFAWAAGASAVYNAAHNGDKYADTAARYATSVYPHRPSAGQQTILLYWIGINDISVGTSAATLYADVKSYWAQAKTDGFTVCAFTLTPAPSLTSAQETQRNLFNELVRSAPELYTYLIEPDASFPIAGLPPYYQSANTHLDAYGNQLLAAEVNRCLFEHTSVGYRAQGERSISRFLATGDIFYASLAPTTTSFVVGTGTGSSAGIKLVPGIFSGYGGIYGSTATPSTTNFSFVTKYDGATTAINATTLAYIGIANAAILSASADGVKILRSTGTGIDILPDYGSNYTMFAPDNLATATYWFLTAKKDATYAAINGSTSSALAVGTSNILTVTSTGAAVSTTTEATNSTTASLVTAGGLGVAKKIIGNSTVEVADNFITTVAGKTLLVKSGTNALAGTVTLVAGAATITSTAIDVNTVIVLSLKTSNGTPSVYHPNVAVATGSATITGLATDTSVYNWVALKVN